MILIGIQNQLEELCRSKCFSLEYMTGPDSFPVSSRNELISNRHGGSAVAQYLRQELHGLFESVNKSMIPELFAWIKEIGGYFKRFKGGAITPWKDGNAQEELTLEARATLAFFEVGFRADSQNPLAHVNIWQVDKNLSDDAAAQSCGATSSVAIFHSLDSPSTPFFAAQKLSLTVAHCGSVTCLKRHAAM
jgi:protein phosphatase PTC6